MTRSLYVLGAAALAYTGTAVAAAEKTYQLADSFNSENFFDSFDFFESDYDKFYETGDFNHVDPTSGYVNYLSRSKAEDLGIIATQGTEMYIGVDHATPLDPNGVGRNSVRLESKKSFNSGLIVAKFSHLPAPVCGTWPGYWMYGSNWPSNGEIDIYEQWNNAPNNLLSLHTTHASEVDSCKLEQSEMTDPIVTKNCDNYADLQYTNQGCGVTEENGLWGSASGGVYATEWTDDAISIWSWPWGSVPSDIDENPNPSNWGTPRLRVKSSSCNIKKAFNDQKIVLNIDFCGTTAGIPEIWNPQCGTKAATCKAFVASTPDAFNDVFWKIQSINVFQLGSASSTTTSTSTTSTSTSTTSSSTSTTSSSTTTTSSSTTDSSSFTTDSNSLTTDSSSSSSSSSTSSSYSTTIPLTTAPLTTGTSDPSTSVTYGNTTAPYGNSTTSVPYGSTTIPTSIPLTTGPLTTGPLTTGSSGPISSSLPPYPMSNRTTTAGPTGTGTGGLYPTGGSGSGDPGSSGSGSPTGGSGSPTGGSGSGSPTGGSGSGSSPSPTSWTTSTITTTSVYTITSCPATVHNCPYGQVTTTTITLGVTVCPVTATPTSTAVPTSSLPAGYTTSTIYTTSTYTITSCKPTVTNCPASIGKVTTETVPLYVTVCPIGSNPTPGGGEVKFTTKYTTVQATTTTTQPAVVQVTATVVPKPGGGSSSGGNGGSSGSGSSAPYYPAPGKNGTAPAGTSGSAAAAPSGGIKPPTPSGGGGNKGVVTAGAAQTGVSALMAIVMGAMAVFAL